MRRFRSCAIAVITLAAACGGSKSSTDAGPADAHVGPDAGPPDATTPFGCLGKPLPTTAPANVTVSGTADQIKNLAEQAFAGVTIKAYGPGGGAVLAMTTSATDGTFALTLPTGGTPLDGYVVGHHDPVNQTVYLDTRLYPPHALIGDQDNATMILFTRDLINTLASVAQKNQDPSKGLVLLIVADCNGNPLAGATVTSSAGGDVVYDSGGLPSGGASMTDTDGRAFILNVPIGTTTVNAHVQGMDLRAHAVESIVDVVTTTVVQP